jgi:hypothetical protein
MIFTEGGHRSTDVTQKRFFGRAVSPRPPGATGDERGGLGETALPNPAVRVTSAVKTQIDFHPGRGLPVIAAYHQKAALSPSPFPSPSPSPSPPPFPSPLFPLPSPSCLNLWENRIPEGCQRPMIRPTVRASGIPPGCCFPTNQYPVVSLAKPRSTTG